MQMDQARLGVRNQGRDALTLPPCSLEILYDGHFVLRCFDVDPKHANVNTIHRVREELRSIVL